MSDLRVLFFGDSHVAGVGDPTGLGWPGRVVAAADRVGASVTAHNLGARGASSVEVLSRWHDQAQTRVSREADCRAVVSFGVADVLRHGPPMRRRVPKHLGHLLDELAAAELWAFVVGPAPIADAVSSAHLAAVSSAFDPVCTERSVPYAPVFEALSESELWSRELADGDGANPGEAGYELLAAIVIERGLVDWLIRPVTEPQGLPHRRFARPADRPGSRAPSAPGNGRPGG